MTFAERASAAGYAAGWRVVRGLPDGVARKMFDAGADYAAKRGGGPEQLRRNLARVLGVEARSVPEELIRASIRSYARYWREAFRLPSMNLDSQAAVIDRCVQGREHLDAALAGGSGAVLALPHSGNWDMAGMWLVRYYGRFSTVAERLEPESLYQRFVDYRESLGFEIFALTGGEVPPFAALSERLRENKIVCLLSDRDLAKHGVPVTFFGESTRMAAGPARLALDTGAHLLPVHCYFDGEGWGFTISPRIQVDGGVGGGVETATQQLADSFAKNIERHPADWHMLQPLWMSDLSEARRARIEGT